MFEKLMSKTSPGPSETLEHDSQQWLHGTLLFKHWSDMKNDILLHKWYESERAGHDIGWERATTSWMIHHSRNFKGGQRAGH